MIPALNANPVQDVAGRPGAENEVDPHRHDEEHDKNVIGVHFLIREQVSQGIANQKAENRIENSKEQADHQDVDFRGRSEEGNKSAPREMKGFHSARIGDGFRKGVNQDDENREDDEEQKE